MIHNTLLAVTVSNPVITLSTAIWGIYIGAVIGWAAVLFNKFVPGTVVRRILSLGLFSPDKAMTVDEMKIKFPLLRYMLRDGSSLRRTVKSREEEEKGLLPEKKGFIASLAPDPKRPVKTQHFYIPEDIRFRAEARYSTGFGDIAALVIGAVVLLAAAFVLFNFGIPAIMDLLGSLFA